MIRFINWFYPENIYWFIFYLVFIVVSIFKLLKIKSVANFLSQSNFALNNYSFFKYLIKFCLYSLALFFLFLALMGPQWSKKNEKVEQKGRNVLIALDISKSMLAQDLKPNRLALAKQKIKKLVNLLQTDRVGLLLYSGTSFVQCPLTRDLDSFVNMLDQVDVETISSGTTAIDKALIESLNAFDSCGVESNKIVVLFTDGEDFSSNLDDVKNRAEKEDLHIFTVGVATQTGAPIPLYDIEGNQVGHQKYKDGSIVISKLNESVLRDLSEKSGGYYIQLTEDDRDLKLIASKVKEFEQGSFGNKKMKKYENQYPYFVLVSFVCLLIDWLL